MEVYSWEKSHVLGGFDRKLRNIGNKWIWNDSNWEESPKTMLNLSVRSNIAMGNPLYSLYIGMFLNHHQTKWWIFQQAMFDYRRAYYNVVSRLVWWVGIVARYFLKKTLKRLSELLKGGPTLIRIQHYYYTINKLLMAYPRFISMMFPVRNLHWVPGFSSCSATLW